MLLFFGMQKTGFSSGGLLENGVSFSIFRLSKNALKEGLEEICEQEDRLEE